MRTFFLLYVVPCKALMSLRGAKRRGNLPEGNPCYKTHARYFCTCVEKKAQTSKRVSVIACDNVISKAQFATHLPEGNPFFLWHVTGAFAPLKSPDKSQGNAIIRSIIADYFVPKILSPASPRPGTM